MKQHKNIQAVLDWYKRVRPDMLPQIKEIVGDGRPRNRSDLDAMLGLLLQGFEAGREFQKKHPNVESGAGY